MSTSPATSSFSNPSNNRLVAALVADEFVPFYQPLWDVRRQRWEGVEALIRWQHPTKGLILPDHFISVAEQSGFILRLGDFILSKACKQMMYWREHGLSHGIVAVNISALQIHQADFVDKVASILRDTGLPPQALELELTETVALEDTTILIENMHHCRSLGVRLSIDDFGTGSSSLARLQCCPVTRLKIDKTFISHMTTELTDHTITESIITLGHNLNLSIVAEGVETAAQQQLLEKLGCDVLQGFRLARPSGAITTATLWPSHHA